jgi:hypothetical protein
VDGKMIFLGAADACVMSGQSILSRRSRRGRCDLPDRRLRHRWSTSTVRLSTCLSSSPVGSLAAVGRDMALAAYTVSILVM